MATIAVVNENASRSGKPAEIEMRFEDSKVYAVFEMVNRIYQHGFNDEVLYNNINSIKGSLGEIGKSVSDDLMMVAAVCICRIDNPEIAAKVANTMARLVKGDAPNANKSRALLESTAIIERFLPNESAIVDAMERFRSYVREDGSKGDQSVHHKLISIQGMTDENYGAFLKSAVATSCSQDPLSTAERLNRIARDTRNGQSVMDYAQMLMMPKFDATGIRGARRMIA